VRYIITQTHPHLQPLLPALLMESLNSSDSDNKILAALQLNKFKVFLECLNGTNSNVWCNKPYHYYLLETVCQMKNNKRLIKLLVGSAADPNINNRILTFC